MLNRSSIPWAVKTFVNQVKRGNVSFDHVVQRGFVWDEERQSLLIHSLMEGFAVPPFYCKKDEKMYYIFDGKQRGMTFCRFLNGEFKLHENTPPVYLEGEEYDVWGSYYEDLPEELQEKICDYGLNITMYDNQITDKEVQELFYRINNGKSLTAIEHMRVKTPILKEVQALAEHPLVYKSVRPKGRTRYNHENLVMQVLAILNVEDVSFERKPFNGTMTNWSTLSEDQETTATACMDRINSIHEKILGEIEANETRMKTMVDKEAKKSLRVYTNKLTKAANKIKTRTHLVTLAYILNSHPEYDTDYCVRVLKSFFDGGKRTSVSERYNECAGSGSAHEQAIKGRIEEMSKYFVECSQSEAA